MIWVIGEDESKQIPSLDYIANWKAKKGVTFTVVRDANFLQTYGSVNNFGINSLPHIYVVRATNMELLFADGGQSAEAENLVFQEMGVEPPAQ